MIKKILDKLVESGLPLYKIHTLLQKKGDKEKILRECLCTQIISQNNCQLGELVRQTKLNF